MNLPPSRRAIAASAESLGSPETIKMSCCRGGSPRGDVGAGHCPRPNKKGKDGALPLLSTAYFQSSHSWTFRLRGGS